MENETTKQEEIPNDNSVRSIHRLLSTLSKMSDDSSILSTSSYVVGGIEHLPLDLPSCDDLLSSQWNITDADDINRLRQFYNHQIPVQCRIRDCTAIPTGFRNVMMHQHVHNRKYTHLCAAPGCYVPFDKLGNAKRHVAT